MKGYQRVNEIKTLFIVNKDYENKEINTSIIFKQTWKKILEKK